MTQLISATDNDFAWLLGEAPPARDFREAPGGAEQRSVLRWLRVVSRRLQAAGLLGTFLIVDDGEVVGLCGFKGPPDAAGSAEIGYGVAETRRGRGHATTAVSILGDEAGRSGRVKALRAETSTQNPASQRVLERNGFVNSGRRHDAEDGELLLWSKSLVRSAMTVDASGAH